MLRTENESIANAMDMHSEWLNDQLAFLSWVAVEGEEGLERDPGRDVHEWVRQNVQRGTPAFVLRRSGRNENDPRDLICT